MPNPLFPLLVFLLLPMQNDDAAPRAPEIAVHGINTFIWRLFDEEFSGDGNPDTPEDRYALYNRTDLTLTSGSFVAGLQADFEEFDISPEEQRLSKRYLSWNRGDFALTVGDYYASFGRGTALGLARTHEGFGLENVADNTLDGLRATWRNDHVALDLLAGRVEDRFRDTRDELGGGSADFTVNRWLSLGTSLVRADLEEERNRVDLVGYRAEFRHPDGSYGIFYEEFHLDAQRPLANGAPDGRGRYLESTLITAGISVSAEYKQLDSYLFRYATPAILEEQGQDLLADFFSYYGEDLEALKVRIDYSRADGSLLYAAFSTFDESARRHPVYGRYGREILHMYGGYELILSSGAHLALELGGRRETGSGYYELFDGDTVHGAALFSAPLPGAFGVQAEYQFSRFTGELLDYQRDRLSVTVSRSHLVNAGVTWERSNLPGELFFTGGKEHFVSVTAALKLPRGHELRLFSGDSRGGLKCSGGVCKYVPAFQGIRLESVIRF